MQTTLGSVELKLSEYTYLISNMVCLMFFLYYGKFNASIDMILFYLPGMVITFIMFSFDFIERIMMLEKDSSTKLLNNFLINYGIYWIFMMLLPEMPLLYFIMGCFMMKYLFIEKYN